MQRKAKQKYATRNKPLLKDYLIGTDRESNRAALEQAGKTILDKLAKDISAHRQSGARDFR